MAALSSVGGAVVSLTVWWRLSTADKSSSSVDAPGNLNGTGWKEHWSEKRLPLVSGT